MDRSGNLSRSLAMDDPYLEQSPLLAGLEVIGQQ